MGMGIGALGMEGGQKWEGGQFLISYCCCRYAENCLMSGRQKDTISEHAQE